MTTKGTKSEDREHSFIQLYFWGRSGMIRTVKTEVAVIFYDVSILNIHTKLDKTYSHKYINILQKDTTDNLTVGPFWKSHWMDLLQ